MSSAVQDSSSGTVIASPQLMRWRYLKDRFATVGVSVGGVSVIFAVVLIFFYLLWVVIPLFQPAHMSLRNSIAVPGADAPSLYYAAEEQGELGLRVDQRGGLTIFDLASGQVRLEHDFGAPLSAVSTVNAAAGELAALDQQGQLHLVRHKYRLAYPENGARTNTPRLEFPHGRAGLRFHPGQSLAVRESDDRMSLAVANGHTVHLRRYDKTVSFLDDSVQLDEIADLTLQLPLTIDLVLIDPLQDWLYAFSFDKATLYFYNILRLPELELTQTVELAPRGVKLRAASLLAGGISLMVASEDGNITQWFPLRDEQGAYSLQKVREFRRPGKDAIVALLPEQRRRGFMTLDAGGMAGVYYATSERRVMEEVLSDTAYRTGTVAPRADIMLLENAARQLQVVELQNEHPEVSWKALWGKIWYESYPEPTYTWQSSAANNDFEPKFSLSPLAFGTLKAAFYAMLFAVPLAIAGAIYTAYFMSPGMRQLVKPTVEVMEALPTVILGFLAGLWLAPFIENYLAGVFLLLLFLPLSMPLTGWLWSRSPASLRLNVPDGWQPALLVLPLLAASGLALLLSQPLEQAFFGGSLPIWLDNEMGISYDQRNSLVVGLAMGFAVIPTIFSIAEDAVFSVPKQLSQGSLALGATPWQTLVRVVLPTASPGIFSGLMIGLGRAVGETMIVLMATGNTPIMDFNIFEGFRTLSANIAVEMPESEVGSTHFRILFLAGLVLFLFTFVVNTLAEVIRQRLRMKYSNL